ALRDHTLGPQVHREVGPVISAVAERVPRGLQLLLPRLVVWREPPKRREVDADAIVEARVPERGRAFYLVEEGTQPFDDGLLRGYRLALGSGRAFTQLARERLETPLLMTELRSDIVVLHAEQRVLTECVDVKPDRVAPRRRR